MAPPSSLGEIPCLMAFSSRVCREKGGTAIRLQLRIDLPVHPQPVGKPQRFQPDVTPGDLQLFTQGDHILIPPFQNGCISDQRSHVLDGPFGCRGIGPDQEHEGVECVEHEVGVELGPSPPWPRPRP